LISSAQKRGRRDCYLRVPPVLKNALFITIFKFIYRGGCFLMQKSLLCRRSCNFYMQWVWHSLKQEVLANNNLSFLFFVQTKSKQLSTNINKTNNHLSSKITEHKKDHTMMTSEMYYILHTVLWVMLHGF
jgi:hypothetical protein